LTAEPSAPDAAARAARRALVVGLVASVAVTAWLWPYAVSFSDEVGYLGQAQLLRSARIDPLPDSPGSFYPGPGGISYSKYPLFVPLIIAPFQALCPRAIFALGLCSLVVIALVTAEVLRRRGGEPSLALLVLLHPTFVIIARTAMPDTWLAAAAVAAWWFGERGRRGLTVAATALVVLLKPPGIVVAGALVAGVAARAYLDRESPEAVLRRVAPGAAGLAVGLAVVGVLNWVHWRHLGYTYKVGHGGMTVPTFSLGYLRTSGVTQLVSLLLVPPGLLAGAWGLWRHRMLGPLFVVAGVFGLMSVYFFVDTGRSWPETLIMAQRLMLPASAFLLMGCGLLLSATLRRRPGAAVLVRPVLAVAAPALALAIGWQHHAWQRPMHEALVAAERAAAEKGVTVLGTSPSAMKVAMMHRGPVVLAFARGGSRPPVVLCSLVAGSYRQATATSCDLPGYETRESHDAFRVLVAR
jgi:hypothetical protein